MANEPNTLCVGSAQSKTCSRCGEEKPETVEFFPPRKRYRNGLNSWCYPCVAASAREWRASNPDKARAAAKRRYEKDPEKHKAAQVRFRERHPERRREIYRKHVERQGPKHRLRLAVSAYIATLLRNAGQSKRGSSWEAILGYSSAELAAHIERQFTKGMSWNNYGEWHLDHIVPVSAFAFSAPDDPEFLACWALTNLRPMWAAENMSKGGKRIYLI